jgi:hypothetical protein
MDLWTVWGDRRDPYLIGVSETEAKEYVKTNGQDDLYIQNDDTAACYSYDATSDKWVEE